MLRGTHWCPCPLRACNLGESWLCLSTEVRTQVPTMGGQGYQGQGGKGLAETLSYLQVLTSWWKETKSPKKGETKYVPFFPPEKPYKHWLVKFSLLTFYVFLHGVLLKTPTQTELTNEEICHSTWQGVEQCRYLWPLALWLCSFPAQSWAHLWVAARWLVQLPTSCQTGFVGLNCVPHIQMLKSLLLVPQNVTIFSNRSLKRYLRQNKVITGGPNQTSVHVRRWD